eukprot:m.152948 g.152948  ORF g.152948 m.152948 type:complete len:75 (-) comp14275_c0_seq1:87-311(-)
MPKVLAFIAEVLARGVLSVVGKVCRAGVEDTILGRKAILLAIFSDEKDCRLARKRVQGSAAVVQSETAQTSRSA